MLILSGDRSLIVHAAELGMARSINRVTFDALQRGIVSCASLMAPCPWFTEAAEIAGRFPYLAVGVQLTLTSYLPSGRWCPISGRRAVPSLTDESGYFLSDAGTMARRAELDHLATELKAQVDAVLDFGIRAAHIDGRILTTLPRVIGELLHRQLSADYSLPVFPEIGESYEDRPGIERTFELKEAAWNPPNSSNYDCILDALPEGLSVLTVFLGEDDEELRKITQGAWFHGSGWRVIEATVLRSEEFVESLRQRNIRRLRAWPQQSADATLPAWRVVTPSECRALGPNPEEREINWTKKRSTGDQMAIEEVLEGMDLTDSLILHVGAGNSDLAARFSAKVRAIDALTVSEAELVRSRELRLPNYRVVLCDKHEPGLAVALGRQYDVIVDNNIASFACCADHLPLLFAEYKLLLTPEGSLYTHHRGMEWSCSNRGIVLSPTDLIALSRGAGLRVWRMPEGIYRISHADEALFPSAEWLDTHRPTLLTFDDGPLADVTSRILDILIRFRLSAVFFIQGNRLADPDNRRMLDRIADEGHLVGSHCFSHRDLTLLGDQEIRTDILKCEDLLGPYLSPERLLRPPYGKMNERVADVVRKAGYEPMFWNIDPEDWNPQRQDGSWVQQAKEQIAVSAESVVVLHDIWPSTADHLESLILSEELVSRSPSFFGRSRPVSRDWAMHWNIRPGVHSVWRYSL